MVFPFKAYCQDCIAETWHYDGKCKWEYLHMPPTPVEPDPRLTRAWDFLEQWQNRLSRTNGEKRLDEFYSAMFKFLKREGLYQHSDVSKI